ncbi:MAG: hypothetical protein ACE5I5_06485 [Candidatus Heimdallarchaeota archaeon]
MSSAIRINVEDILAELFLVHIIEGPKNTYYLVRPKQPAKERAKISFYFVM